MKKVSAVKLIASFILLLDKILPNKVIDSISNFGINAYIDKYANVEIIDKHKLDKIDKPVIFICNHLSNADGLILNKILKEKDVTFIMGVKLAKDPVTNLGVRLVKAIEITPSSPDKTAISNLVRHVKSGNNILIFPEGTRSRDGSMIKAKKGIYLIARLCGVPIVPLCIYGSEKFMPIDKSGEMKNEVFHKSKVFVKVGDVIELPSKLKDEEKLQYEDRAIDYLMRSIANMLPHEYRGVYGESLLNHEKKI